MIKILLLHRPYFLALLALCGSSFAEPYASAAPQESSNALTIGREIQKDSQAFVFLKELTSRIGSRMSATAKGRAAEDFVYSKLMSFGIRDVKYEQFPMESWQRGVAELLVDGKSIPSAAMVYTPSKTATAEIVDLGNGASSDYASNYDKVRGKIALVYLGTLPGSAPGTPYLPRWERLALAVGHGAIGVVFINAASGHHLVTGIAGGSARTVTVPVVVIDKETGLALQDQLRRGHALQASIVLHNTIGQGAARNVIATIPGSDRAGEVVVLGGHLDSLDLATGAVDNGTGAMWVLDVARAFAKHHARPRRTVQFIFFMGEEEGLLGSYSHVRREIKHNDMQRTRYMINTDMSVNPVGLRLWGGNPDLAFFQAFASEVRKLYPSFSDISTEMPDMSQSSDSQPYIERGVPIAYPMAQWPDGLMSCVHAECDDMHWVTESDMRRSAVVGAMLLCALADAPETIAHVMSPDETADYFKQAKITRGYLGPAEP